MAVYLKSDLKNHMSTKLVVSEFTFNESNQRWEKQSNGKWEFIYYSYTGYEPHGFIIEGLTAMIAFDQVDEMVLSTIKSHNLPNSFYTIAGGDDDATGVNYDLLRDPEEGEEITSEATFDIVAVELQKIIDQGVMPFLNQFHTVEDVADELVNLPLPAPFVRYFGGPIYLIKAVAIFKIAYEASNNSLYLQKRDEFYSDLNEGLNLEPRLAPFKLAFEELFMNTLLM